MHTSHQINAAPLYLHVSLQKFLHIYWWYVTSFNIWQHQNYRTKHLETDGEKNKYMYTTGWSKNTANFIHEWL